MSISMERSHVVNTAAVEAHHHNKKNRNFLLLIVLLGTVIILLVSIFITAIIYRRGRSEKQNQSLLYFDADVNSTCVYGMNGCEWGAICSERNQCQCVFNCTEDAEPLRDETTGIWYLNRCQYEHEKCKLFYERTNLTCSTINCSHGAQCAIDKNGNPRCSCPKNCDDSIRTISSNESVCGTDHHTYSTACELKKKACERQEDLRVAHLGKCQHCQDLNCSTEHRPVCASNFQNYSNECQMKKSACQLDQNLTKLHDGLCTLEEQQRFHEVCQALFCSNGRTCVINNGKGTCECLFNCSSEKNPVCGSNGKLYGNECQLEQDRCIQNDDFQSVDHAHCCDTLHCPYGRCQRQFDGNIQCECPQCSNDTSSQELICGDNGITYPSKCFLEHDACTRQIEIKASHLGQCNNCQDIVCPFHGQCQAEHGTYTCVCPTKERCQTSRTDPSHAICGSNQELFYSQCEMDVRSCELKTHLYAIAPHYCTKQTDETEYNEGCDYDEPLLDPTANRQIECDTIERCPYNSYCNKKSNRCCVKVINAMSPYRMCLEDGQCGRNMICKDGFCQCASDDLMPAKNKRECVSFLLYPNDNSSCHNSPFGCCRDNQTISPTFDRRGCPEHCNCHPTGSLRTTCDPETGSCYCRPAVSSSSCSHCENEYWAFTRISTHNNTGCTPCGCHPYGSTRRDCLQDTGQCLCHSYTTGRQCDRCFDSSMALTEHGCVKVDKANRQRTCRDLRCFFDGICEMINGQPRCTCFHIVCTRDEQRLTNICASDGRTYKSQCEIKRQQCVKQYEIVPIYPGVCHGTEDDLLMDSDDERQSNDELPTQAIDSKRCATDRDCGENMVCLSEFCECAKQKYQRIAGPKCIMAHTDVSELQQADTIKPTRHTLPGICSQQNLCENQAICQDEIDGSYQCLCTFGWTGRYCNEKIDITIPYFNRQSYVELNPLDPIQSIDIIFTTERRHGLIFYWEKKSRGFYWIISIRNKILELVIRSDQLSSTIPLSNPIDLHTFIRLQIQTLHNEIQIKLNEGQILSRLFPFEISFQENFYLGGIPDRFNSLYSKSFLDEGFQGCVHYLSINGREILFNHSQFIAQNLKQCLTNLCQSKSCQKEVYSSSIDRCLINPCENNEQCVNVHPNNYLCICRNCSLDRRFTVGFHSNSYIKHLPLKAMESTGRFQIEIWFLSETSSGLLIYSEHINSKKGHMKLFIQRKMLIFNMIIGSQSISLSSRYPIELNRWHQCLLEIHGQKLMLILDQEPPVISYEFFSAISLWPRSFTFIGYLPIRYRSTNSSLFEGFRGGIQKIIINENQTFDDLRLQSLELLNITEYYGYPCQPNPCLFHSQCRQRNLNNYSCEDQHPRSEISLELDGTINTIYPYKPLNLNRNYFDLLVKTKYSLGLIFYIGETSLSFFSSYLSLILVDGFVQFTAKIHVNSTAIFLKSKVRIDDGQWHRIEIERFRRRIIMKLDDHHRYQTVLSSKETEFDPNPSFMYIGGYHRLCSYNEQHCRSYRGCLKNVTIDNQYIHLINDEINQNRLLKQCHDLILR